MNRIKRCHSCKHFFSIKKTSNPNIFCSRSCQYDSLRIPLGQRFWTKVKKTTSCWEWIAGHRKGYGAVAINHSFNAPAHRVAWELSNGAIPPSLLVLHHCDNKNCVNPKHLFLGTVQDNKRDEVKKHRHAFGERNGAAQITEAIALAIRQHRAHGMPIKTIANKFQVTKSLIDNVVYRNT